VVNLYTDLPPRYRGALNVVVEIPSGSVNKIEYHNDGFFRLDRALYSAVYYPFEYGFLPQTMAGDGDALDIVLLVTHPTFTGCVVQARPIGILRMEDDKGVDDKIIAVPMNSVDPRFKKIKSISDIEPHVRKEIQEFLLAYKKLEKLKFTKFVKWEGIKKAETAIKKSIKKYTEAKK
jgi:inorganic pyrophosphatase